MPRYFLNLKDGTDVVLDDDGAIYPDVAALQSAVLAAARDCVAQDVMGSGTIDCVCALTRKTTRARSFTASPSVRP